MSSGVKVNVLLPDTFNRMEDAVKDELAKDPAMDGASRVLGLIGSAATDAIRRRLNFDVLEVLGRGWVFANELHEYKDQAKHPRGERSIVSVGKHEMKTQLEPIVTLTVGPISKELHFTLEVTAHINAVALSICDGNITGVGTGDGSVEAQLKFGEIPLHDPIESRQVTFPGRHDFAAPGLEIE